MIFFVVIGVIYIAVTMTVGLVAFGMALRRMAPIERRVFSTLVVLLFASSVTTLGLKGCFNRAQTHAETAQRSDK